MKRREFFHVPVHSDRGAPMGRPHFGEIAQVADHSVRLFRVTVNRDGYDPGGAYWGLGKPVWVATDDGNYRAFVRASSRIEAVVELGAPKAKMRRSGLSGLMLGTQKLASCAAQHAAAATPYPFAALIAALARLGYAAKPV